MLCLITSRRLKPGTFDEFRRAWEPRPGGWPPNYVRGVHARSLWDADQIVSFALADITYEEFERWRQDHALAEGERERAIAPFVASTDIDDVFEVIDEPAPA